MVAAGLLVSALVITPAAPQTARADTNRLLTAVDVARVVGGGRLDGLDRIILVTTTTPADGLIAAGLAGFWDGGGRSGRTAILPTTADSLPGDIRSAISDSGLGTDALTVLGGTAAISEAVHIEIARAAGWSGQGANPVRRIGGEDRFATAAAVMEHVRTHTEGPLPASLRTVVVTNGEHLTDALSAAGLAYRNVHMVALARASALPAVVGASMVSLPARCVVMVGGPLALSDALQAQTRDLLGAQDCAPERLAGTDRFTTAVVAAERVVDLNGPPAQIVLGADAHAAAIAAPLAGGDRALVLTAPSALPPATATWVQQHVAAGAEVLALGDTSAVADEVLAAARATGTPTGALVDPPAPVTPPTTPPPPAPPAQVPASSMQLTVVVPANPEPVALPLRGTVDVTIDWGDGAPANCPTAASASGDVSCSYPPGTYTIAIGRGSGAGPWLTQYGDGGAGHSGREYITEVSTFGDLGITSLSGAFYEAVSLTTLPATLPATVTDLSMLLLYADNFTQDLSGWDTSGVTDMSAMFKGASAFNGNISAWVTDQVTDMSEMFDTANSFNQNISGWNVGNVTNMHRMFNGAASFNQNISGWNVGNVSDMSRMFQNVGAFNRDLSGWCVPRIGSKPTDFDTAATAWVLPNSRPNWGCGSMQMTVGIPAGGATMSLPMFGTVNVIIDWGVGAPAGCPATATTPGLHSCNYTTAGTYTITIGRGPGAGPWLTTYGLGTSYVAGVELITEVLSFGDLGLTGISLARTGNPVMPTSLPATVTSIEGMFAASDFNRDISGWDTSNITNMGYLISGNQVFNQDISGWNVGNVTDMSRMFQNAGAFNQNIGSWDTAKVTNMNSMFRDAIAFNQDLSGWCVPLIASEPTEFATLATAWNASPGGLPQPVWGTCPPPASSMHLKVTIPAGGATMSLPLRGTVDVTIDWGIGAPAGCPTTATTAGLRSCTYAAGTYDIAIGRGPGDGPWLTQYGDWDTKVTGVEHITEVVSFGDLGITRLSGAFAYGSNPVMPADLPAGVTDLEYMFFRATTFNQPIGTWDTGNVTSMHSMFRFAEAFNQPIGTWDTSKVTNMTFMFLFASAFNQDISGWDTGNVTSMQGIFGHAHAFNQPIGNWDVGKVTTFAAAFNDARAFNQPLSTWNTSNATDMGSMFQGATAFNQDLSGWCVPNVAAPNPWVTGSYLFSLNTPAWTLPEPVWGTCPPPPGSMQLKVAIPAGGATMALPLRGTVDVTIDWGDGAPVGCPTSRVAAASIGNVNCVYTAAGSYTITIRRGPGDGPWLTQFGSGMFSYSGVAYITEVVSFGDLGITSLSGAFNTGGNPIMPDSIPTGVTNFSWMFSDTATFNRGIGSWDTSHATDMEYMFFRATAFNQDISAWDISKVTNMYQMFHDASTFNQNLSGWCVPLIANEPTFFALRADAWTLPKPVWGTCPA